MRPPKKDASKRQVNPPKPPPGYVDDDSTAFQSPDDDNGTDYGLEFTSSQLALDDGTRTRCSTMRKDTSTARRARVTNRTANSEEDIENRSPVGRSPRTPRTLRQMKQKNTALRARSSNQTYTSEEDTENHSPVGRSPRTPRTFRQMQQEKIAHLPAAAAKVNPSGAQRRKTRRPKNHMLKMQQEIQRLQQHAGLLIPRLPFSRLVREIMTQLAAYETGMRVTEGALQVMQESSELYLTHRLQDSYLLTMHRGRVTLEVRDMALMALLCKNDRLR